MDEAQKIDNGWEWDCLVAERDTLLARVAELQEALSLAPCECDQLRGFDKCPRCLALNK